MMEVTIKTENAAFSDGNCEQECARILREVADALDRGKLQGTTRDANGNRVGDWYLDLPEPA